MKPQPCLMENQIQNYRWGQSGEKAYIPALIGIMAEPGKNYAELWIGSHPKALSKVITSSKKIPLNKWIGADPEAILGPGRMSNELPFLLKVLSIAKPLSIQAHPNKSQAKILNSRDSGNYPDTNHKPEIAIALDSLKALVGFKTPENFRKSLNRHPELIQIFGSGFSGFQLNCEQAFKEKQAEFRETLALKIASHIKSSEFPEDNLFLELLEMYPATDPGLFFVFLLNMVKLEKYDSIFIPPGVPHAYLEGNIVECMANSDNVVRAGLTPKFVDIDSLLEILDYTHPEIQVLRTKHDEPEIVYPAPVNEFCVTKHSLKALSKKRIIIKNSISIFLVIEGVLNLSTMENEGFGSSFCKGQAFAVPACTNKIVINALENACFFQVTIP